MRDGYGFNEGEICYGPSPRAGVGGEEPGKELFGRDLLPPSDNTGNSRPWTPTG